MEGRGGYYGGINYDRPLQWYRLRHYHNNPDLGHHLLRHFLGLSVEGDKSQIERLLPAGVDHGDYSDAVLVSIDVEGRFDIARELGISTLDLRALKNASDGCETSTVIKSFNYRFQVDKDTSLGKVPVYNFGASRYLHRRWIPWLLNKVLRTGSPNEDEKEPRKTTLIGNSISSDLGRLKCQRGSKWRHSDIFPDVPILDIQMLEIAARGRLFSHPKRLGLSALMEQLEIYGTNFHCGGNDAYFTLKVLLGLGVESCSDEEMSDEQRERKDVLESIVKAKMPRLKRRGILRGKVKFEEDDRSLLRVKVPQSERAEFDWTKESLGMGLDFDLMADEASRAKDRARNLECK